MRNQSQMFRLLLAGIAGLYVTSAVGAQTVPIKEHCKGTLTSVVPGTLHFAGKGNANHFGKYSIVGSNRTLGCRYS